MSYSQIIQVKSSAHNSCIHGDKTTERHTIDPSQIGNGCILWLPKKPKKGLSEALKCERKCLECRGGLEDAAYHHPVVVLGTAVNEHGEKIATIAVVS